MVNTTNQSTLLLPSPQPFTGMYILLNPSNGNVEGISSSPTNRKDEIWVSKEDYGKDYMWLSNMRRVDGHWVEKPKMKTIWRKADGSSGTVEADVPIGEEWTEVECPSGMRKPVFYEGEWVEEGEKKVREENERLREQVIAAQKEVQDSQMSIVELFTMLMAQTTGGAG